MSKLFLNPLVWLRRFRKRRGYGVHSPFAFNFITDVVYERWPYYAYRQLDLLHPQWVCRLRLRPVKLSRLLFRIANYAHPRRACILGGTPIAKASLQAAVPSAQWTDSLSSPSFDFIYLDAPNADVLLYTHPDTVLVLDNLQTHLPFWQQLLSDQRVAISFDLYDVGIVMFNKRLNRKDYIVNF